MRKKVEDSENRFKRTKVAIIKALEIANRKQGLEEIIKQILKEFPEIKKNPIFQIKKYAVCSK